MIMDRVRELVEYESMTESRYKTTFYPETNEFRLESPEGSNALTIDEARGIADAIIQALTGEPFYATKKIHYDWKPYPHQIAMVKLLGNND